MIVNSNNIEITINDYYKLLPKNAKGEVIRNIMKDCELAYPTVLRKLKKNSWSALERKAVENILNNF